MSERTCDGCGWFRASDNPNDVFGECRRFPPMHCQNTPWLSVRRAEWCGEWADGTLTAEQAERQELTMRFALAIVQGVYANPEDTSAQVAKDAQLFAREFLETVQEGQQ